MDVVRTSVQGWLSPAPGSLGWGPIVARLPSFGQVPPSTLPDFFLAKLMPRLPTRPPRRIPLVTPTLLSSLICRADCRCRDGVVSPALAPPQDWPCAAPGPTQPGSQESPARDHPGEGTKDIKREMGQDTPVRVGRSHILRMYCLLLAQ